MRYQPRLFISVQVILTVQTKNIQTLNQLYSVDDTSVFIYRCYASQYSVFPHAINVNIAVGFDFVRIFFYLYMCRICEDMIRRHFKNVSSSLLS